MISGGKWQPAPWVYHIVNLNACWAEDWPCGLRSEHDLAVVNRLVAADQRDDDIKAVFARYPCGKKAKEGDFRKYLERTIKKARRNGHLFFSRNKIIPSTPNELKRSLAEIRASEKSAQARQECIADQVTDYFDHHGRFFTDVISDCHRHLDGATHQISDRDLILVMSLRP